MDIWVSENGKYVLGVYCSIKSTCLCVVKVFRDKVKWEVIEDFVIKGIDLKKSIEYCNLFIKTYDIQHVFGNSIAKSICDIDNKHALNTGEMYEGFEVIELDYEHLILLTLGNVTKVFLNNKLKEEWEIEFKNCDIEKLKTDSETYPRIFALANVLHGVRKTKVCFLECFAESKSRTTRRTYRNYMSLGAYVDDD